jgi:ribonuclease BN (tRNA processing enzyme)
MLVAAAAAAVVATGWWIIHMPAVQDAVLRRAIDETFAARRNDLLAPDSIRLIGEEATRSGNARIAKIMSDILRYHTTPVEAASEANQAGVGMLVMSHLGPPTPTCLRGSRSCAALRKSGRAA